MLIVKANKSLIINIFYRVNFSLNLNENKGAQVNLCTDTKHK